jgi:drug/metabolite transporter (DMT)-like permease
MDRRIFEMPIDDRPGADAPEGRFLAASQDRPRDPDAGARFSIDPLLVLIVAVWAINVSFIKIAVREISPLAFNFLRMTIASLVLLTALYMTERNFRIARRHLLKVLFLSFSGYAVCQTMVVVGISLTTATNAAVIFGTSPIVISLLSSFFKHDKIARLGWVGVALGFVGVYVVIQGRAGGFHLSGQTFKGDLVLFISVCLWAHYSVSARPLVKIYSPLKFSALTISLGTLFSLPMSFAALRTLPLAAVSTRTWGLVAYGGVISLAAGLIVWLNSVKRVGNTQTATYSNIQPVLAIVFAHFLLNDSISSGLVAGALLIFTGIFFTRRGRIPLPAGIED